MTGGLPMGRRVLIATAALATAFGAISAPAYARGGGHRYDHYGSRHDYYGGHYRGDYRYYDYRRKHRKGHISGGEAALIAAGVIGGLILIDRSRDDGDRRYNDRRYENRRYDDRRYDGRRYDDRRYDDRRYDDRRYDDDRSRRGAFEDDYYYQRDDRRNDDRRYEDSRFAGEDKPLDYPDASIVTTERFDEPLDDDRLLGGPSDNRKASAAAASAFRECVAETRGAVSAGGMTVAMPSAPSEVQSLADGSVRMIGEFRAANRRGESWTRRFVCEADSGGVRFLQID